jgi:predicted AAA+ superfamily ATPase
LNSIQINQALQRGDIASPGVLPKLEELRDEPFVFRPDFGLPELPEQPGILLVRGARQYGKSTWMQQRIAETIERFGPGTAFYLNGDEIRHHESLAEQVRLLLPLYSTNASVRRLFIDEITAVVDWERAIKMLADAGELRRVLLVTTGSKAADLRRGAERLPGRKGRLDRTSYIFTPIPFTEFKRICGGRFNRETLIPAYLLSGGSPPACSALAAHGRMPEYVIEMVRDWIYGAFAASKRPRAMLLGALDCLHRFAGTPVGQSKLAREAGLANNSVAAGYIELLADLLCVSSAFAWDASKGRPNRRRPCKFHMTNLLAATAWHPAHPRSPEDYLSLPPDLQGRLLEWLVAQECWRRAAIRGDEMAENMLFWQGGGHEIDFVLGPDEFVEVKRGETSPFDFSWFPSVFPKGRLTVIGETRFETDRIIGVTMEDFLSV